MQQLRTGSAGVSLWPNASFGCRINQGQVTVKVKGQLKDLHNSWLPKSIELKGPQPLTRETQKQRT